MGTAPQPKEPAPVCPEEPSALRCENPACRARLIRKPYESNWHWGKRRHCDRSCAQATRTVKREQVVWTVGMIETTQALVQRGKSAQQIAAALKEFGYPPVSRNAVIGCIHRRNLRNRPPEPQPPPAGTVPARERSGFSCRTAGCRNTRQPGRDHCAACITDAASKMPRNNGGGAGAVGFRG